MLLLSVLGLCLSIYPCLLVAWLAGTLMHIYDDLEKRVGEGGEVVRVREGGGNATLDINRWSVPTCFHYSAQKHWDVGDIAFGKDGIVLLFSFF